MASIFFSCGLITTVLSLHKLMPNERPKPNALKLVQQFFCGEQKERRRKKSSYGPHVLITGLLLDSFRGARVWLMAPLVCWNIIQVYLLKAPHHHIHKGVSRGKQISTIKSHQFWDSSHQSFWTILYTSLFMWGHLLANTQNIFSR